MFHFSTLLSYVYALKETELERFNLQMVAQIFFEDNCFGSKITNFVYFHPKMRSKLILALVEQVNCFAILFYFFMLSPSLGRY